MLTCFQYGQTTVALQSTVGYYERYLSLEVFTVSPKKVVKRHQKFPQMPPYPKWTPPVKPEAEVPVSLRVRRSTDSAKEKP